MLKLPLDRSSVLLIAAIGTAAVWALSTLAGHKPDGALLGFSGSCLLCWTTVVKPARAADDEDEDDDQRQRARTDQEAAQISSAEDIE